MRIDGCVLAGGEGRRMGADKALVTLAGKPLLSHVIARFAPQVDRLWLSANGDAARFARFGLPVVPDAAPMGPLSGVLAALRRAAADGATALVTVPVDSPFLPGDLVPRLCLAAEAAPADLALARSGGRVHPVFALWPVAQIGPLAEFLASGAKPRLMDFAAGAALADFPDDGSFDNLNTPDDLAAAEALLRSGA